MRKLLNNQEEPMQPQESPQSIWLGRVFGFLGSGVIFWIVLGALTPILMARWGIPWLSNLYVRSGIVAVSAILFTIVLSRIENTIWARYYVIIGYLLCVVLLIWIVLRLLHYV